MKTDQIKSNVEKQETKSELKLNELVEYIKAIRWSLTILAITELAHSQMSQFVRSVSTLIELDNLQQKLEATQEDNMSYIYSSWFDKYNMLTHYYAQPSTTTTSLNNLPMEASVPVQEKKMFDDDDDFDVVKSPETETERTRKFFLNTLEDVEEAHYFKSRKFHNIESSPPETIEEFKERVVAGDFSWPEDRKFNAHHLGYYMHWGAKPDMVGHSATLMKIERAAKLTKRAIMATPYGSEMNRALNKFEDTCFFNVPVANDNTVTEVAQAA